MRPILSNDKKRLYSRLDYNLLEKTKLSEKSLLGSVSVPVINASSFTKDDYIIFNDPDKDRSEMTQILSIAGNTFNVASIAFQYENKTNVYRLEYNIVKFFEDATVISTVTLKPDYLISVAIDSIKDDAAYTMSFFNTTNNKESPKGEPIISTEQMFCSSGDIFKYEDLDILGNKVIDKIDIASRDIRNVFRTQSQSVSNIDEPDLLRSACAVLSLKYIFMEITKAKDDIASMKMQKYGELYDNEIRKITDIINLEDDNVRVFGQSRAER